MMYKPERALTQTSDSAIHVYGAMVEMMYKPERALTRVIKLESLSTVFGRNDV